MQRYCSTCLKVKVACYCHLLTQINNKTRIIILQHPSESRHPLGTGKMAALTFKNSSLLIGENFSEDQKLNQILKSSNSAILWPNDYDYHFETLDKSKFEPETLVLIDATWRKAYKMFMLSENLHELPKMSFKKERRSIYYLRKEPKENFLSTIEAISFALNELEGMNPNQSLKALSYIQEFQLKKMGREKFQKNYLKTN